MVKQFVKTLEDPVAIVAFTQHHKSLLLLSICPKKFEDNILIRLSLEFEILMVFVLEVYTRDNMNDTTASNYILLIYV